MAELAPEVKWLLEGRALAHIATVMKDGSPQLTPVWVTHDGTHVVVNTRAERQKVRNLQRDPRTAINVVAAHDLEIYVQIRGRVVEMVEGEAASESFRQLMLKYRGKVNPAALSQRVMIKIFPEHIDVHGQPTGS